MNKNLIGVSAKIGNGKDTFFEILAKKTSGAYENKKFSYKLKKIASILTGIPIEKFEDQEFKKTNLGKEWNKFKYSGNPLKDNSSFEVYEHIMTVREFLQRLGTEAMREGLHENVWLNALYSDFDFEKSKWCITDMRFKNELESVKKNCGITVRINRPNSIIIDHPSETELDNEQFDYVIENNGTLEDFEQKIDDFLQKFNII
jgi:hypothetical protein